MEWQNLKTERQAKVAKIEKVLDEVEEKFKTQNILSLDAQTIFQVLVLSFVSLKEWLI